MAADTKAITDSISALQTQIKAEQASLDNVVRSQTENNAAQLATTAALNDMVTNLKSSQLDKAQEAAIIVSIGGLTSQVAASTSRMDALAASLNASTAVLKAALPQS